MSTPQIPTPRTLVTSLLNSIANQSSTTSPITTNALKDAPSSIRPLLLTLHVLFPNDFLPALDVLDRRLVTRFRLADDTSLEAEQSDGNGEEADLEGTLYFVRSAQQPSSHSRFTNPLATHYEVRPLAWNCSCPAFAFAAFPSTNSSIILPQHAPTTAHEADEATGQGEWTFGGLSLGEEGIPVCKHLLACVLVERCAGLFGAGIEERVVSREEFAGWCAGWGG
jgi:hypothetical protein